MCLSAKVSKVPTQYVVYGETGVFETKLIDSIDPPCTAPDPARFNGQDAVILLNGAPIETPKE
jgi:hypothetical protein